MEVLLEILKYTLPSAIVLAGVYFVLKNILESEQRKMDLKYRSDNMRLITPIKLQAYERVILYLERITLSNLVMRTYQTGMSSTKLQSTMLQIIRSEYDHNMAQQLYIPSKTWRLVKASREETVKIINSCADKLEKDSSGLQLSQFIFELIGKVEITPTEIAIEALKAEVNKVF